MACNRRDAGTDTAAPIKVVAATDAITEVTDGVAATGSEIAIRSHPINTGPTR